MVRASDAPSHPNPRPDNLLSFYAYKAGLRRCPTGVWFCLKMVCGPGLRVWSCRTGSLTVYTAGYQVSLAADPLGLKWSCRCCPGTFRASQTPTAGPRRRAFRYPPLSASRPKQQGPGSLSTRHLIPVGSWLIELFISFEAYDESSPKFSTFEM